MKQYLSNPKIILIEQDNNLRNLLTQLIIESHLAQVVASFNTAEQFFLSAQIPWDLLLFDIENLGMRGKQLIKITGSKPSIVITTDDYLKEAVLCHPIDTLIKPLRENLVINALMKAVLLIKSNSLNRELVEFNTAKGGGKRLLKPKDFVFVNKDEHEPRNKVVTMRHSETHILMNYSISEIEKLAPHLLRLNRNQLVCPEIITHRGYDHIYVNIDNKVAQPTMLTIGRDFAHQFKTRLDQLLFVA
jgi:DNA-binding response OmpR family regulator